MNQSSRLSKNKRLVFVGVTALIVVMALMSGSAAWATSDQAPLTQGTIPEPTPKPPPPYPWWPGWPWNRYNACNNFGCNPCFTQVAVPCFQQPQPCFTNPCYPPNQGGWNGGWNAGWNGGWNGGWNAGWNGGWNGGWNCGWNGGWNAGWGGGWGPVVY